MNQSRCRRCNSPLTVFSLRRSWANACPECQQPCWLWLGDLVSCRVKKLSRFGITVEFGEVEGMIHVSELGDDVRLPSDRFKPGEMMDAVVLHIDPWDQRIGLSAKRAKAAEP